MFSSKYLEINPVYNDDSVRISSLWSSIPFDCWGACHPKQCIWSLVNSQGGQPVDEDVCSFCRWETSINFFHLTLCQNIKRLYKLNWSNYKMLFSDRLAKHTQKGNFHWKPNGFQKLTTSLCGAESTLLRGHNFRPRPATRDISVAEPGRTGF